jgi:hypothetical protein
MIGFDLTCLRVSFVLFEPHAIAIANRDSIGRVGEVVNHLVTNAKLADIAKETGLVKHVSFLNPKIKEKTNEHVLGTVVEALLGAIHEDSGKDMEAVRRAMHMMGLVLPTWYTARSKLYQPELQKARAEFDQPEFQKARAALEQYDLQKARAGLDQPDLRSHPNRSDLHEDKSELHRIVVQKQEPAKKSSRRERRRLETLHKPQEKVDRGLSEHMDLDEGSFGYRYRIAEEQATSDEDLEALDAAPVWRYHSDTHEEICEDYGTEHAVLEDANSDQTHFGDQDADRTGLETPTTHQERIEPTAAKLTSSSWRELMRGSGDSQRELGTTPKQKSDKSTATEFDRAMGAMMLEECDGSLVEHELVGRSEWPVRHGWFPQRCQITLDVALSKQPDAKEEVAACEPDRPPTAPTLDDATLSEQVESKEEVAAYEPDSLLAATSLEDVAPPEIPHTTKEEAAWGPDRLLDPSIPDDVVPLENPHAEVAVAVCEPDSLLAAPTLDDVALSEPDAKEVVAASELDELLPTSSLDNVALSESDANEEVAVREPDRLLAFSTLIALSKKLHAKKAVAASGLDSPLAAPTLDHGALSKKPHTNSEVPACEPDRLLTAPTLDDIALPKLPTTKEVAAYEPDRLRLIVAPHELDRLVAF